MQQLAWSAVHTSSTEACRAWFTLFTLLPTPTGSLYHYSIKMCKQVPSHLQSPPVPENTRHLSPMLCPITNLHIHKLFVSFSSYI